MPQGLGKNLYPTLSVAENIDFFARLFGHDAAERKQRIDELTSATGLFPFKDRPAGKLSGGMKQKLGLCCSLVHDPDLLILDEPTTGVDPLSRRQFWELIDSIRQRRPQMSVLVATAYMEEAEQFDWLAAMYGGKVIATGTAQEMKDAFNALKNAENDLCWEKEYQTKYSQFLIVEAALYLSALFRTIYNDVDSSYRVMSCIATHSIDESIRQSVQADIHTHPLRARQAIRHLFRKPTHSL